MTRLGVILAAGLGSRLASVTGGAPKALVSVGGQPLLGRLLRACTEAGLREVIVVTGHRAGDVEAFLARAGRLVQTVYNPDYATAGNARSLWWAREAIGRRSFLKIDGDLVVAPDLLAEMAAAATSTLACDRRRRLDAEAMKLRTDGGRVIAIGKDIPNGDGESVGVERIEAGDIEPLFEALAVSPGYYEDAYQALIDRGFRLAAHDVKHPWVEVDDPSDLAQAEAMTS